MLLFLVIVLLFSASTSAARTPRSDADLRAKFERANRLYDQKKFKKAREIYEDIVRAGVQDAVVLYNLGNACARTGDAGAVVLHYVRALRLAPRDSDIKQNLARLQPPINRKNVFFLLKPFAALENALNVDEWTILTSVFFFLWGITLGTRFLARSEGHIRYFRAAARLFVVLLLISGAFLSFKVYQEIMVKTAIVMEADTLARSGPGKQFEELYKFPAGTMVRIISKPQNGWVRIRLMDGRSAYLPLTDIQPVKPAS